MGVFERDTAVERVADTLWRGELREGWRVFDVPNGGYVLALAGRALSQALPHPDPLTVSAFYMAPTALGPVDCEVTPLRSGGSTSFGEVKLSQAGDLKVHVTAAYTDLDALQGDDWSNLPRPDYPAWDELDDPGNSRLEYRRSVDLRLVSGGEVFRGGEPDGSGTFRGWVRHADGADPDALSLLLFADAFPPPVISVFGLAGWVPTVELTVQVRARPAPGPIQVSMNSRALSRGVVEESGEYWDSSGQLVALSRQTAKFRRPPQ
jgi:acyl-CoA thioesterase